MKIEAASFFMHIILARNNYFHRNIQPYHPVRCLSEKQYQAKCIENGQNHKHFIRNKNVRSSLGKSIPSAAS